jgi:hypothetical protein
MYLLVILLLLTAILIFRQSRQLGYHSFGRRRFFRHPFRTRYGSIEGYCGCNSSTTCNGNNANANSNPIPTPNIETFTIKGAGCGCKSSLPSPFL